MRKIFSMVLAGLLIAVVISIYLKITRNSSSSVPETPSSSQPAGNEGASPSTNAASTNAAALASPFANSAPLSENPADLSARAGERAADTNSLASLTPESALQNVRRTIRLYGETFGGNPVGTNPEITAALAGNNPKHINFLAGQAGCRVNRKGQLVDNWGTPLFFHQISGTVMEIHSAGPDRLMWTPDDIVSR